jgi:HK97 family phage major capsid protein
MSKQVLDAISSIDNAFDSFKGSVMERVEALEAQADKPRISGGDNRNEVKRIFGEHLKALHAGNEIDAREALRKLHEMNSKAMVTTSATAGGNIVPEILAAEIERKLRASSPLYDDVRRTMIDGAPQSYKRVVSDADQAGGWVGEGSTRNETATATLNQVSFPDGMAYAYPKASEELVHGSAYNVAQFVIDEASRTFASLINQAIVDGNGSSKPYGLINTAPSASADDASPARAFAALQYFATGAAGAFQGDYRDSPPGDPAAVLYDAVYSLKPEYRQAGRFYMSGTTLATVAKLRDADGRSLLAPQMSAGVGPLLLGYEVRVADHLPSIAADSHSIIFGDLAATYELVEGHGLRVTIDDNVSTPGQVRWYIRRYLSGNVINNEAARVVKFSAS